MICPVLSKDDVDTANCRTDCKWYCDGECAITVIAKLLADKEDDNSNEY